MRTAPHNKLLGKLMEGTEFFFKIFFGDIFRNTDCTVKKSSSKKCPEHTLLSSFGTMLHFSLHRLFSNGSDGKEKKTGGCSSGSSASAVEWNLFRNNFINFIFSLKFT